MDVISVQRRQDNVKAKHLRKAGFVPGVIFGSSLSESISIQMQESVARQLYRTTREGTKIFIELG